MINQMTTREKTLALIVGALLAMAVTMVLAKVILRHKTALMAQIADKEAELEGMQTLIKERDMWVARDEWLTKNLKPMGDARKVSADYFEEVKGAVDSLSMVIEKQGMATPTQRFPGLQATSVEIQTKGSWENIVKLCYNLQDPTKFTSFENLLLEIDKNDNTQVRAEVRVTRWFSAK
jgi:hypothetical protein